MIKQHQESSSHNLTRQMAQIVTPSRLINGVVVYYWLVMFFERQSDVIERFSPLYLALVIPLNLYILWNLKYVFCSKYNSESKALLWYWVLVSIVSLARLDFPTLYNVSIFTLPIIIIINSKAVISTRLINILFWLSILGSVITHFVGNNEYGFIPGQALTSERQGLQWRVSLFPDLPESGFFSVVVLLTNLLFNKGRSMYLYAALSLYFILLGGSRTTMISLLFVLTFLALTRFVSFVHKRFYWSLFAILMLLFIGLVNIDLLGANFFDLGDQFWNNYFFRKGAGVQAQEDLTKTIYRGWLWGLHLELFLQKPLFGLGTFNLDKFVDVSIIPQFELSGSESLLTSWLARVGLMILPFFAFVYRLLARAINTANGYLYSLCLVAGVFTLVFGNVLIPYSFIFMLVVGAIQVGGKDGLVRGPGRPLLENSQHA